MRFRNLGLKFKVWGLGWPEQFQKGFGGYMILVLHNNSVGAIRGY